MGEVGIHGSSVSGQRRLRVQPAHGDHGQTALGAHGLADVDDFGDDHDAGRFLGHAGEFAYGQAVHIGDAEGADITLPLGVERRAVDLETAEGIGAVEHDDLHALLEAGGHGTEHGAGESVGTGADVLQVDDEGVEALEHGRGRLAGGAVHRIDRQAGGGVPGVAEVGAGHELAVEAVLGREEGDELRLRRAAQDIEGALPAAVHTGGMREQADFLAGDRLETFGLEHVDAEHHARKFFRRRHRRGRPHGPLGRRSFLRRLGRATDTTKHEREGAGDHGSEGQLHE
jgi:hypothetical protein